MSPTEVVKNICTNRWNWDLIAFARRIGRDPHDGHTQELFRQFDVAAVVLGRLDPDIVEVIAEDPRR